MEEKHLTRAILIGADTGEYDAESSMDELSELAKTAGAEELARVLQKREAYEPATVIGEGKLAEVKELCGSLGAGTCDIFPSARASFTPQSGSFI